MKRRRAKKELRAFENYLAVAVEQCLSAPLKKPAGEYSEAALSLLRRVNNVVFLHLQLARTWPHERRFLEYLDKEIVSRRGAEIRVRGEFIWWPLGCSDAHAQWWPDDRVPRVTKYGGKYLAEPFRATMRLGKSRRRPLIYKFEFGAGKTQRVFTNGRGVRL